MKYRGNIFFLGMALAYGVLFIVQAVNENLLAIQVYYFVAWASLELAVLELVKTVSLFLSKNLRLVKYIEKRIGYNRKKEIKKDIIVERFVEVISYFQYIFIFIMAIITPIKDIPNSVAVNKQISCLSLLSFAMLFLNTFLYQWGEDLYKAQKDKIKELK
jgi:hypothetical protein